MAGTIVHLAVATQLDQLFANEPERYLGKMTDKYCSNDFFAGNICPDGIMAREGYCREMKLHTHMRDGIPDGTFQQPEHLQLFRKRLSDFFAKHNNKEERFSLYLGYLTHMLTDEKFILEIHPYVLQRIAVTGYDRDNPQTYVKFGRDVDQIDFRLVKEFPGIDKAYQALCQVTPYEIADYITEQELTASREWIKNYFFETEHTIEDPIFLPYQEMYQFIPEAVSQICDRLPEYITSGV